MYILFIVVFKQSGLRLVTIILVPSAKKTILLPSAAILGKSLIQKKKQK